MKRFFLNAAQQEITDEKGALVPTMSRKKWYYADTDMNDVFKIVVPYTFDDNFVGLDDNGVALEGYGL